MRVFVAASSQCFPNLSFDNMLQRLVDLEFTSVEIAIHERGGQMRPRNCWRSGQSVGAVPGDLSAVSRRL